MTDYSIGLFPMCADILHAGHVAALKEAKSHCNKLIVALNCDPDGKNPIQSVFERYLPLAGCKYVDAIIPYAGRRDLELLCSMLDYDVRFLGADYIGKEWDGKQQEEERGIPQVFLDRSHGLSSTELKERIKAAE